MLEHCVAVFYHAGTLGDTVYFERGSTLRAFHVNHLTRASRARLQRTLATLSIAASACAVLVCTSARSRLPEIERPAE